MNEPGSPSSDPADEAPERLARERSIVAMLRQLWLALSTYRLYPENPNRPGFETAVERVGAAVADSLRGGTVSVEIRGDRFVWGGSPLPRDEAVERLALACFERRVERLTVLSRPDASDLERLYSILTRPPVELEEAGGVEDLLRESGVTSVSLSPIGPGSVEEADHVPEEVAKAVESRRLDADVLASELMVEDLHGSPADQAETLLARLRHVMGEGSLGPVPPIDLHSSVHDLLTELPVEVRRSLVERLVDQVQQDPVAGRLIGTMSNAELTRALVDIGGEGLRDPAQLARELASAGVRRVDLVDLTQALEAGQEDAGTIIAGLEQLGIDLNEPSDASTGGSVMEVLAHYLTATRGDDASSIRSAIDATLEEAHATGVLAVADYLALETDLERAGEALAIWSDELRGALVRRDEREVAKLLQPVRSVLLGGGLERPALFEAYVRRALTPEVVLDAVTADAASGRPHLAALLAPFGDDGVEVLLDLLADENDRQRRALLLGALRRIAHEHPRRVVARLSDPRWYVVRNAVSILGSARNPTVLTRLAEAAAHGSAEVRREVPEALANAGGPAAAPHLAQLAIDGPEDVRYPAVGALGTLVGEEAASALGRVARAATDRPIRTQALDELDARPESTTVLQGLVSGPDRLPWGLRRHARRVLARARRSESR